MGRPGWRPHYSWCPGSDTPRGSSVVKVLFLETVEGSGTRGEVKTVANGYARNYLLPRGYAAPATPAILKRAAKLAAEEEQRQLSLDEQARRLVGKLEGQTLVCAVRVGEQGRLYGSVTNADIAEKAGEILGEELDRRRVLLPEVIRQVGLYSVPLRLSRNVTAEVQVAVVDVDAPEGVEAAVEALLVVPEEPEEMAIGADVAASAADTATDGVSEQGQSSADMATSEVAGSSGSDADQPEDSAAS
jgi:large subunit ribosomal protein L9